jgi:hypothetical protein
VVFKGKDIYQLPQKKFFPSDIISIINDSSFWSHLYELQSLILPLCAALNKLQKDMA